MENSPGLGPQEELFRYQEESSTNGPEMSALLISKISVPFRGEGDGPLLRTVPFRYTLLPISRIELFVDCASKSTVRLGDRVMLSLKE